MVGGLFDGEEMNEYRVRVEDGTVEVVTVEVVVESVEALLAAEPARRVTCAETGIGRPAIGPSFEDVERDGRRHFLVALRVRCISF